MMESTHNPRARTHHGMVVAGTLLSFALSACGPRAESIRDVDVQPPESAQREEHQHVELIAYLGIEHVTATDYSCSMLQARIEGAGPEVVLWPVDEDTLQAAEACRDNSDCVRQLWADQWPEPCRTALGDIEPPLVPYLQMTDEARSARDTWEMANPFGPRSRDYLFASATLRQREAAMGGVTEEWLHSPEYAELTRDLSLHLSFVTELNMGAGGELHVLNRMTVAIENELAARPSSRVVVLVPPLSRYYVFHALRNDRSLIVSPPLSALTHSPE